MAQGFAKGGHGSALSAGNERRGKSIQITITSQIPGKPFLQRTIIPQPWPDPLI
jgi:hypothetical protein